MPSEHARRKDDTWTSEELNKALKGSKSDMLKKKKGDEDAHRLHSEDVNSSDRRSDLGGRAHRRDEDDKRSRRHKDRGDSPDQIDLTEEDREKLRQERRTRREGGKEEKKPRPKASKSVKIADDDEDVVRKLQHRDKDDDRHSEKKHNRSEGSQKRMNEREEERRGHQEGVDRERSHHRDTAEIDNTRRHQKDEGALSRRHRDDSNRQRRHEESKDRLQITEEESGHHARKSKEDDNEEKLERRRQERREKREREKSRDKEKNREKRPGSQRQNEKSERDHTGPRHSKDMDVGKSRYQSKDRHRDQDYEVERGVEKQSSRHRKVEQEPEKRSSRHRDVEHEPEKRSSRHRDVEHEPEKRSSRHRDVGRESEKQSRRQHEVTSHTSSTIGQFKSEGQMADNDEDEYNYEEDFEDYEDDFEDDKRVHSKEESEMEDVLRALGEENNKLVMVSRRSNRSDSSEPSDENFKKDAISENAVQPKRSFVNFVSAKQRVLDQTLSGKARQRFNDLSRLIELDVVKYDIFDLQPVKEYEMYIRSFGRSDTKQAYVQTGDDDIERDIQTEEIETLSKWTQHPPDEETAVGGESVDGLGSEHKREGASKTDIVRLSQFLDKVGRMVFTILDEESKSYSEEVARPDGMPALSFSNSTSRLGMPNFLNGRQVIALSFCQSEPDYLLSVHSSPASDLEKNQSTLQNVCVICVWNLSQPTYPYRICGSQMRVTSACFSPTKAFLVFAGMHDGSVALWDLREPSSDHRSIKVDGKDHLVRYPTYNTAGVMESENHHSPVVSIVPVYSSIVGPQKNEGVGAESSSGLSFQLASIEEKAVVNLWVVAEVAVSDPAGSEADLGLSPGGKIKLLRSSSIILSNPNKYMSTTLELRALNLHLDSSDLNHFYVGTDTGHVVHGVRFGKRAYPHSHCSLADSPIPVVSLDFSPFGQAYFLAGCEDGTLHLFNTKFENPIASWRGFTSGDKILNVRWSHSRPTVFFVLDNKSTIFTFDLVENGLGPVKTDKITAASAISVEVGGDPSLLTPGTSRPAHIAVALSNGTTEILTVNEEMRDQQPLEEDFMASYVDRY